MRVIYYRKIFSETAENIEFENNSATLQDLRKQLNLIPEHTPIWVNGGRIDDPEYIIQDTDSIIIRTVVAGTYGSQEELNKSGGTGIVMGLIIIAALVGITIATGGMTAPWFVPMYISASLGIISGTSTLIWGKVGAAKGKNTFDTIEDRPEVAGARNQMHPQAPWPIILGKHRITPYSVASYWTEPSVGDNGKDIFLHGLLVVGFGPLRLTDFRLGDAILHEDGMAPGVLDVTITPDHTTSPFLTSDDSVTIQIKQSPGAMTSTLYGKKIVEEQLNTKLIWPRDQNKDPVSEITYLASLPARVTSRDTSSVSVTIAAMGFVHYDADLNKSALSDTFTLLWRNVGDASWNTFVNPEASKTVSTILTEEARFALRGDFTAAGITRTITEVIKVTETQEWIVPDGTTAIHIHGAAGGQHGGAASWQNLIGPYHEPLGYVRAGAGGAGGAIIDENLDISLWHVGAVVKFNLGKEQTQNTSILVDGVAFRTLARNAYPGGAAGTVSWDGDSEYGSFVFGAAGRGANSPLAAGGLGGVAYRQAVQNNNQGAPTWNQNDTRLDGHTTAGGGGASIGVGGDARRDTAQHQKNGVDGSGGAGAFFISKAPIANTAGIGGAPVMYLTVTRTITPDTSKQYEVTVRRARVTNVNDIPAKHAYADDWTVTSIRSITNLDPIAEAVQGRICRIAFRIKATQQMTGMIEQLNCVASSILPTYNPTTKLWPINDPTAWVETANPADLYLAAFRGVWCPIDFRDASGEHINLHDCQETEARPGGLKFDWPALQDLWRYCNEPRTLTTNSAYGDIATATLTHQVEVNWVITDSMRLIDMLAAILLPARASFYMKNARYSLVHDAYYTGYTDGETFVPYADTLLYNNRLNQQITTAVLHGGNSKGFAISKTFAKLPDALKITFISAQLGHQELTITVWNPAVPVDARSTIAYPVFEEMTVKGITNIYQSYLFGYYVFGTKIGRQVTCSCEVDIEQFFYTVGTRVAIAQETLLSTIMAGRITDVVDQGLNFALHIDSDMDYTTDGVYGLKLWSSDTGVVYELEATPINPSINPVSLTSVCQWWSVLKADITGGEIPCVDMYYAFGPFGNTSREFIVSGKEMNSDFSAKLYFIEFSDYVHTADAGTAPSDHPTIVTPAMYNMNVNGPAITALPSTMDMTDKVAAVTGVSAALLRDAASDGKITPQEKAGIYQSNWLCIWNEDQRTTALPTEISSITVLGEYRALAVTANALSMWSPGIQGTKAYTYYQALEAYRSLLFTTPGFLLTANRDATTDISLLSPSLDTVLATLQDAKEAFKASLTQTGPQGPVGATGGQGPQGPNGINAKNCLNLDPWFEHPEQFVSTGGYAFDIITDNSAPEGNNTLCSADWAPSQVSEKNYIPIDRAKNYRVRFWAKADTTGALMYMCLMQYLDNAGNACASNGGRNPYKPAPYTFPDTAWHLFDYSWSVGDWQSGMKFVRPDFLLNYLGHQGRVRISGLFVQEDTRVPKYLGTIQTVISVADPTVEIVKGPQAGNVIAIPGDYVLMTATTVSGWNQGYIRKWNGTEWVELTPTSYNEEYMSAVADIMTITSLMGTVGFFGTIFVANLFANYIAIATGGSIRGGTRFSADGVTETPANGNGFWLGANGILKANLQSLFRNNVIIGTDAGANITDSGSLSSKNTIVGDGAGVGAASASFYDNSIYGYIAGKSLSTGRRNVIFGARAGELLTTGNSNVFGGYLAGNGIQTGDGNVGLGNGSLSYADGLNWCLCLGTDAYANANAGDHQMNLNSRVRYFEFLSTATQAAVYAILSLFVPPTQYSSTGCVGCRGAVGGSPNQIFRSTTTSLTIQDQSGNSLFALSSSSGTAIGYNLQILLVCYEEYL